jgi:glucose-6-phosphate 1-dehydrogenase
MPATCTEVVRLFRKPPSIIPADALQQNHLRIRINPDVTIAMGMTVIAHCEEMLGEADEMVAMSRPRAGEMDAYERVLGAAMEGDTSLFARQNYIARDSTGPGDCCRRSGARYRSLRQWCWCVRVR